ncbi:MAG: glycosyltransferase [Armatimonadota bacterium]|nr:glycosyltransferase [Armatimonadota bacterium]
MQRAEPVLSVVIPTDNRVHYVTAATQALLSIEGDDLEVVVEDNSDGTEVATWLAENVSDPRLSYRHTETPISMTENFEAAMERTRGTYVCFIGDDDGVSRGILNAARWAAAEGLDALTPRVASYDWPDVRYRYYGDRFSGTLNIPAFTGSLRDADPQAEMRACVRKAGQSFCDLPKVYHGLVRRACLQEARRQAGVYFPGPCPDLGGALAVANYAQRVRHIDHPLVISGRGARSMGGLGAAKKHVGRLEDFDHLSKESIRRWSNLVPRFFAGTTVWGETVVQALTALGRDDLLAEFNVPLLHGMCAAFEPGHIPIVVRSFYRAARATRSGYVVSTLHFAGAFLHTWSLRLQSAQARLRRKAPSSGNHVVAGLSDIGAAMRALDEYLQATGRLFTAP